MNGKISLENTGNVPVFFRNYSQVQSLARNNDSKLGIGRNRCHNVNSKIMLSLMK